MALKGVHSGYDGRIRLHFELHVRVRFRVGDNIERWAECGVGSWLSHQGLEKEKRSNR